MRRSLTLPVLLLLAASALAAPLTLSITEEGWAAVPAKLFPTLQISTDGVEASGGKIAIKDVPAGSKVFVYNLARNLGIAGTPEAVAKAPITAASATHLINVTVTLLDTVKGEPKPYPREASVVLLDGDREQTQLATNGTVTFHWVKIGEATITVKSRGDDNKSRVASQKVTLERDGLSGFVVSVTGEKTATQAATGGGAATGAVGGPIPSGGGGGGTFLGNLLSTIIGLAVVGGLAFAAWRYTKANPDKVTDALTKIGADVPKPLDPDLPETTPAATPAPVVPSGPIILDPSPEPIQIAPASTSLSAAPTGIPKLIGSDGSAFELPEGETIVGREAIGGLMIGHDTVSRRHARLVRSGSNVSVEDFGSTNGTWVNDAPVPANLHGGESVRFGQVSYRYEA